MPQESMKLDLKFRGSRNYITGADIAQSMLDANGNCTSIRFEFHHMAACALKLREVTNAQLPEIKHREDVHALMAYLDAGGQQKFMVAEQLYDGDEPQRVEYDETVYTRGALIDGDKIHASMDSLRKNPIDAMVALNKYLLNQSIEIHPWIFVRLDLSKWPLDFNHTYLKFTVNRSHGIFRSEVFNSDQLVGNIYFSKRSP